MEREKYAGCIDSRVIELESFKQWRKFLSVNLSISFFLVTFVILVYTNFEKFRSRVSSCVLTWLYTSESSQVSVNDPVENKADKNVGQKTRAG